MIPDAVAFLGPAGTARVSRLSTAQAQVIGRRGQEVPGAWISDEQHRRPGAFRLRGRPRRGALPPELLGMTVGDTMPAMSSAKVAISLDPDSLRGCLKSSAMMC